ncbi:MAG TPA: hypothetical protein VLG76_07625 [Rhabdochlamydiaceae bacterium]|nr:hypothetical protein [Rhabdochlamydiaceae bacterium]
MTNPINPNNAANKIVKSVTTNLPGTLGKVVRFGALLATTVTAALAIHTTSNTLSGKSLQPVQFPTKFRGR